VDRDGFASVWPGPFGKLGVVRKVVEVFAVFKNMLVRYTEGESRHKDMNNLARGQHTWYKRLNVSEGMEGMRLDNWEESTEIDPVTKAKRRIPGGKSLRRMEDATTRYLTRAVRDEALMEYAPPREMLKQVAQKVVLTRRARERTGKFDRERWESFSGMRLRHGRRGSYQSAGSAPAATGGHGEDGAGVPLQSSTGNAVANGNGIQVTVDKPSIDLSPTEGGAERDRSDSA
jgi:hypothetical protein